jgi:hypothetical protein|tara:strand:- start:1095 stop:1280 length:186 start_codon:yes stop_codon:yes gene_type:complete
MNIIDLAKQVGYPIQHEEWRKAAQEFAALVAAQEREACAKACEHQPHWTACAAAIRARGTT